MSTDTNWVKWMRTHAGFGITDQEFVEALYGGLLDRAPDASGLAHYMSRLREQRADPQRYKNLVADFVAGEEFHRSSQLHFMVAGGNPFLPDMGAIRFTQAVSLGSFCHSAMALKQAGLRHQASPFDWLFSNPRAVAHAIEDDFNVLLDPSYYQPVPLAERSDPVANLCEHTFYREHFGVHHMFNHHLPTQAEDHAYFVRSVQRFRRLLSGDQWTLFLLTLDKPIGLKEIEPLLATLRAAPVPFVLVELLFRVAKPTDGSGATPLRIQREQSDWLRVELDVAAPSNGTSLPEPADSRLLNTFLRSFQIDHAPPVTGRQTTSAPPQATGLTAPESPRPPP